MLHLNKGSKYLSNTDELINDLIIREDPDIFSLAESNINFNYDKKEIGAATLSVKKLTHAPKKSIMTVFVKKTLNYSRLHNYENDLNSFIWIKISIEKN